MELNLATRAFDTFQEKIDQNDFTNNQYMISYPILLKAANDLLASMGTDAIIPIAHMAYGWMPTILKKYETENNGLNHIYDARKVTSFYEAKNLIGNFTVSPINNSIVGLSKVLHFVNPEYFPIWDRRVARHFEIFYHYNINRFENYIEYIDFIESANEHKSINPLRSLIKKNFNYEVTKTRASELILFM